MSRLAASEATFGSVSRGDFDSLSDRDILIVDNDLEILRARTAELEQEGWSVAAYTFPKLEALSTRGALFLQHLKLEATVLRDQSDGLRKILTAFHPLHDYSKQISENHDLIELAANRPATSLGALWAADVLYVAARNWGIMTLAGVRCYKFSYSQVLEELAARNLISDQARHALLRLRLAKSLYRSGERVPKQRADIIVSEAVATTQPLVRGVTFSEVVPSVALNLCTSLHPTSPNYHRLRGIERSYVALQALRPNALQDPLLDKLRRWIANPRAYANLASRHEQEIAKFFAENSTYVVSPVQMATR